MANIKGIKTLFILTGVLNKIILKNGLNRHFEPFLGVAEVGKGVAVPPCWGFSRLSPRKALSKPTDDNFVMKLGRNQVIRLRSYVVLVAEGVRKLMTMIFSKSSQTPTPYRSIGNLAYGGL